MRAARTYCRRCSSEQKNQSSINQQRIRIATQWYSCPLIKACVPTVNLQRILQYYFHCGYSVEQKSRADFAPDIELPLSKLTATEQHHAWKSCLEIKIGNQAEQCWAMLSNAERYLAIFYYIYGSLLRRDRQIRRDKDILLYAGRDTFPLVLSLQSILFMRRTRFVLHILNISTRK